MAPDVTDIETTTVVPGRLLSAWMRTFAPAASVRVTGAETGVVGLQGAENRTVSMSVTSGAAANQIRTATTTAS